MSSPAKTRHNHSEFKMMEDGEHPDSPFPGINFKCAISLMSKIPPHTNAEFHIRALYSEGTGYVPNFVPNFGDPMRTNVPALRAAA